MKLGLVRSQLSLPLLGFRVTLWAYLFEFAVAGAGVGAAEAVASGEAALMLLITRDALSKVEFGCFLAAASPKLRRSSI